MQKRIAILWTAEALAENSCISLHLVLALGLRALSLRVLQGHLSIKVHAQRSSKTSGRLRIHCVGGEGPELQ